MSDRAVGGDGTGQNLARPVARATSLVAYGADIIILLTLIAQMLLGEVTGARALLIGTLAIAVFVLAAGLALYAGGTDSSLLAGLAGAYSLISAAVIFLGTFEPDSANIGLGQLVILLVVAAAVAGMALATARIAGLPTRRLSLPFIILALVLTIVATILIVFDSSLSLGGSPTMTLGRLIVALVTTGAMIALFLHIGRAPGPSDLGRSRRA